MSHMIFAPTGTLRRKTALYRRTHRALRAECRVSKHRPKPIRRQTHQGELAL